MHSNEEKVLTSIAGDFAGGAPINTDNLGDFWFEQIEPWTYSLSIKKGLSHQGSRLN